MSASRVSATVDALFDMVVSGEAPVGEALPAETALARTLDVSRLTLREAVRVLTSRGVLQPVHGRGTFVNPPGRWTDLDSVVSLRAHSSDWGDIAEQLVEIRRMIEVGSAGLAAARRSRDDLDRLAGDLQEFEARHEAGDAVGATAVDLDFHDHVLQAAGNPFLFTVYEPLRGLLERGRAETSASRAVRERAMRHHRTIYDAIEAGDAEAAEQAMSAHMDQTARDAVAQASRQRGRRPGDG